MNTPDKTVQRQNYKIKSKKMHKNCIETTWKLCGEQRSKEGPKSWAAYGYVLVTVETSFLSLLVKGCILFQVGGNTIYNMLKLADGETDINEKPHNPHKIIKTKVKCLFVFYELLITFSFCCVIILFICRTVYIVYVK